MAHAMSADGVERRLSPGLLSMKTEKAELTREEIEQLERLAPGFVRYIARRRRRRVHPLGTHWRQYSL